MNVRTLAAPNVRQAPEQLGQSIDRHLKYELGKDASAATLTDWRYALSAAVRDLVVDPWFATTQRVYAEQRKRVYYLSMEFLIGRLLEDAIAHLGLDEAAREAIEGRGVDYDALLADEADAALGNGGLGRLAACFLDSMSTVGIPAYGYGIRYQHGLFRQSFDHGQQVEQAEDWLRQAHAWEYERVEATYPIGFGGRMNGLGWEPGETMLATAYDTPVPGWGARWVNTLRLWSAKPLNVFELGSFNRGDFVGAAVPEVLAHTISRVLYPDDTTAQGKELRLKQEYFFTAASLADIMRRFLSHESDPRRLPAHAAIQLNDTHPAIAVPELVRLLVDQHGLGFDEAFETARACLSYTNHTLMPEALERWPVELMGRILPRHLELIERIDARHAAETRRPDAVRILDGDTVRMGDLAFIGTHRVNGVSALHTDLMRRTVFADLHALHPERIVNQTNGITPRRWLETCNPGLSRLVSERIGTDWITDLDQLARLAPLADDADFRARFAAVKRHNKERLARWLAAEHGIAIAPDAMIDVQVKRIHEYKRQLLNILEAIATWNAMRRGEEGPWAPRVRLFGGKAAPGYWMAKQIIRLINDAAAVINADPATRARLAVVYPPNYNVSMAERIIPAADLSEQISTAGTEASGTGNMKLALNGALTIGTLDGANVELSEAVGPDNIFIFGMTTAEADARRAEGYHPAAAIAAEPRLAEVLDQIGSGLFSPDEPDRYAGLVADLRFHDRFLVAADFGAYYAAQRAVDAVWHDPAEWTRRAVLNTARSGRFSSDRTIRGYARDIWDTPPVF